MLTLVGQARECADQRLARDRSPVHFDFQCVHDDFLGVLVQIRVYECDVIVAGDHVAQCGQALLDSLYFHLVWQRVTQMLQFLVGCGVWNKQAVSVANGQSGGSTARSIGLVEVNFETAHRCQMACSIC